MATEVIDQFRDNSNQQLVNAGDSTNTAIRVNIVAGGGGGGTGTSTVVQGTASNLNATVVGTVAVTESGPWTVTVTQATGANLHAVIDSGTITTVPSGTQPISGTITNVPSGTQPVSQVGSPWGVSGTVTSVPSGTQSVSLVGTETVTGTVQVAGIGTGTLFDTSLQQVLPVRDNDVIDRLDTLIDQTAPIADVGTNTVINIGQVGPQLLSDGEKGLFRQCQTGATVVTDAHGRYTEASRRKKTYTGIGIAITPNTQSVSPSGLILYNPLTSKVLLSVLNVGLSLGGTPPVIGSFYNYRLETPTSGNIPTPTGTTLGSSFSNLLGTPYDGFGVVLTSATFSVAPVSFIPIQTVVSTSSGVVTSTDIAATSFVSGANVDFGGLITLTPGSYLSIGQGGSAQIPANFSITWEEILI